MCAHTCMHVHAQNTKINMLGNCKWPPPWSQPCLSCLTCMHVCVHVCVHVCMHAHAHVHGGCPHPIPPQLNPPTHPQGGTPQISKNAIKLEQITIFQFHLKILNLWRLLHSLVGVWFGGWVGGSVSGLKHVKSLKFNKT